MKKFSSVIFLSIFSTLAFAQTSTAADMRSSGKIYVVIAVLLIVFVGIALYLFSIDKRLKKIERNK